MARLGGVGDVGTSLYAVGPQRAWTPRTDWAEAIAADWHGATCADLEHLFTDLPTLRLQEPEKQARFKLSYYAAPDLDAMALVAEVERRLTAKGVSASVIWSVDEAEGVGLLDVLPRNATKLHAVEFLMRHTGFGLGATVFSGDSGNDLPVLASPIPSTLVANATPEVRAQARALAEQAGTVTTLYLAEGGVLGLNGHYAAGIVEGVLHYHPGVLTWLTAEP